MKTQIKKFRVPEPGKLFFVYCYQDVHADTTNSKSSWTGIKLV